MPAFLALPRKLVSALFSRLAALPRPWLIALLIVLLAAGGGAYWSWQNAGGDSGGRPGFGGPGGPGGPGGRLTPIVVEAARVEDFPVRLSAVGTVVPRYTVTVRSRVDGPLQKVFFDEGQAVRAGDLLAQIDPQPFEVALTQAQGQLGKDKALLANARADLARYEGLAKLDAIPAQQLDTQRALVQQYEAAVQVDQGAVDNARLQLSYTRITAPVDGRIGLRQVDPGNLVHASDANGLAVITQIQPVTVVFSIAEPDLRQLLARIGLQTPGLQTPRAGGRGEGLRGGRDGAAGKEAAGREGGRRPEGAGAGRGEQGKRGPAAAAGEGAAGGNGAGGGLNGGGDGARRFAGRGEAAGGAPWAGLPDAAKREAFRQRLATGSGAGVGAGAESGAGRGARGGKGAAAGKTSGVDLAVEAWDRDGKALLATGKLLTVDNQIDLATGTVKVKAIFPNQDGALFPNQFVNVKLVVNELKDATVIPAAAVQRGAKGVFVWVLKEDNSVGMRPVLLGQVDGDSVPVREGLQAGEKVAVDGFDRLREGAKVEVVSKDARAVKMDGKGRNGGRRRGPPGEGGPGGPGGPPPGAGPR